MIELKKLTREFEGDYMVTLVDGETVLNIDLTYDERKINICDSDTFMQISLSPEGKISELRTEEFVYPVL